MNEGKVTYYYIEKMDLLGKGYAGEFRKYIFVQGEWTVDSRQIINDRLMGYDPYESDDSPYKIGNLSIMNEIEEISEETAMKLMADRTVDFLREK